MSALSDQLKEALKKHPMSRRELARLLGVSHGTAANYVSGKTVPPTATLIRMAALLRRPVTDLEPALGAASARTELEAALLALAKVHGLPRAGVILAAAVPEGFDVEDSGTGSR
jgi:transcriptional regulator with XRE-family HTH domain